MIVGLVWFGLVLWHINHYMLFNSRSFYTYMLNMICKYIFLITSINEPDLIVPRSPGPLANTLTAWAMSVFFLNIYINNRTLTKRLGTIPGQVIPKTQKMVLDASLLNTQHYKVRIKGKVEQSREMSSALPYTLV